jgi:predicted enzyme related to lactoylglutathione lyase
VEQISVTMNNLAHFAIHATDVSRARNFYESVFDWKFRTLPGAQDFFQIKGPDENTLGAIQSRKYNAAQKEILGFECSISVEDVKATAAAVEGAGGQILMKKTTIPHVGWVIKFLDTEGNLCCAVQFDSSAE